MGIFLVSPLYIRGQHIDIIDRVVGIWVGEQ